MRKVFITEGAHGIGQAIVEAFVSEGDTVAFCDIDARRGESLAKETGARFFELDVCDKTGLETAMHHCRWWCHQEDDLPRGINALWKSDRPRIKILIH